MTQKSRRRAGKGTLGLIALLLVGSALVRAVTGAGLALAREEPSKILHKDTAEVQHAPRGKECVPDGDVGPVLAALQERERRLSQKEAQITDRMHALAVAEEEIIKKTDDLVAAEKELRATLALAETAAEDDIGRLVAVYQAMKPKEAAVLFEAMAPEFAAGFLGRMQADAAAGIMAGLSPKAAYSISVILAGRNANVPKE